MEENDCYRKITESMSCMLSECNRRVEYHPTRSPVDLISYYFIIKLPAIPIKKEYKDKFGLKWNIDLLREKLIKEVQILESGVLFATYTSDYLWCMSQSFNFYTKKMEEGLRFPDTNDKFFFQIPLHFEILEKITRFQLLPKNLKEYQKMRKRLPEN